MAQSDALSELRWALGFQRGLLVFGGPDTLVSACGNQVCFQEQSNGAQVFYRTMAIPLVNVQGHKRRLLCSGYSLELPGGLTAFKSTLLRALLLMPRRYNLLFKSAAGA